MSEDQVRQLTELLSLPKHMCANCESQRSLLGPQLAWSPSGPAPPPASFDPVSDCSICYLPLAISDPEQTRVLHQHTHGSSEARSNLASGAQEQQSLQPHGFQGIQCCNNILSDLPALPSIANPAEPQQPSHGGNLAPHRAAVEQSVLQTGVYGKAVVAKGQGKDIVGNGKGRPSVGHDSLYGRPTTPPGAFLPCGTRSAASGGVEAPVTPPGGPGFAPGSPRAHDE